MNKSESIKELATALSKAQAEMKPAPLNMENKFLTTRYADLGSVIEAAKPILSKNNLAVSQLTTSTLEDVGVETVLMHSSGEWISSTTTMPIEPKKGLTRIQVAGTIISYLRRYSLASIIGMYAGEDTDGHSGNGNGKDPKEEPKYKWPPYMHGAMMDLEIVDNQAHAESLLDLFPKLPKNTSKENVKRLGEIYKARRAKGKAGEMKPKDAAEVAWNEWSE